MIKRFKNIKINRLIAHLIVTLLYPAVKAYISEYNRLLIFTDSLTIIAAILIIIGLLYSFYLHGDFDRASYVLKRGMTRYGMETPFETYEKNANETREDAFNYPLFLGIIYLVISGILAYAVL